VDDHICPTWRLFLKSKNTPSQFVRLFLVKQWQPNTNRCVVAPGNCGFSIYIAFKNSNRSYLVRRNTFRCRSNAARMGVNDLNTQSDGKRINNHFSYLAMHRRTKCWPKLSADCPYGCFAHIAPPYLPVKNLMRIDFGCLRSVLGESSSKDHRKVNTFAD
jgi:hypothetical protein